jgi:transglutaminase-like putative cysteine protease
MAPALLATERAVEADHERIAGSALSPEQPYTAERSHPVVHEVDFRAVVTPPYHCGTLRVWLPLPQDDAAQEVLQSKLSTFPLTVEPQIGREAVYGNKFAYFEFDHPEGAQIIQHQFQVRVHDLHWNVDPAQAQSAADWPDSFAAYLQPQAVKQSAEFQAVLAEIAPRTGNAETDLEHVFNWVDRRLTYDHVQASLQVDANHAFELQRGHCSDYHGLCATMGRTLGYPTRITYGLSLFPKNSPSHCKLEAFLPPMAG